MSKKIINLYIVDNSEQFTGKLEEIFYDRRDLGINVIGTAIKHRACMEDIMNVRQADVFMISAFLPDKMGIELIAHLRKNINPNAKFIVTVTPNTRNLVDRALEAGADNFLQKPFNPTKMVEMIYELCGKEFVEELYDDEDDNDKYESYETDETINVFEIEDEDEEDIESDDVVELFKQKTDIIEEPKPVRKREPAEMFGGAQIGRNYFGGVAESNKPNKIVTFTAPKSSGKTTVLVNTAAAIKKNSEYDPKIIIVDLNIVYPSVQFALHHEDLVLAKKTIYDLMDDISELDKDLLKQAIIEHVPTGIHLLNTPFQSIRDFKRVTKEKIKQLLIYLREEYDLVMVDTSGNIRDDSTMIPMSLSDTNVLLFQSDFTSLVQTRKFVEMVQLFEESVDRRIIDKTMLILNRYDENSNLSVDKAKNTILDIEGVDLNIPLYIPEEPAMTIYTNKGEFIVDKPGQTNDKLTELAALIYPFYTEGDIKKRDVRKENKSLFGSIINKLKK